MIASMSKDIVERMAYARTKRPYISPYKIEFLSGEDFGNGKNMELYPFYIMHDAVLRYTLSWHL